MLFGMGALVVLALLRAGAGGPRKAYWEQGGTMVTVRLVRRL